MFSLSGLSMLLLGVVSAMLASALSALMSLSVVGVMTLEWGVWGVSGANFPLVLIFDKLSLIMSVTVILISFSVLLFSSYYMKHESSLGSFYLILFLFIGSMLVLTLSPGLFSLFIGWDGLGLTSFLLILFYSNSKSLGAAMLTVISNRVGDSMMLASLSLALLGVSFNSAIVEESEMVSLSTPLAILFILGASTKSAQLPFSAWLPAAMAAPTPVSALVHSSTLVTAGVYVMIRFSPFLSSVTFYLLIVGGVTTVCSSLSAVKEVDLKKIVALSTLSQLGVMVTALGAGSPLMSFFHLILHAYFKALMFVGVGDLIHSSSSYQDLKVSGGFSGSAPLTSAFLISAKMALCGLPFFSGFYSKDMILENLAFFFASNLVVYIYLFLSIGLTVIYSVRFVVKVMIYSESYLPLNMQGNSNLEVNLAMLTLLAPGVGGGTVLSYIFLNEVKTCVSPSLPKFLIILSMLVSFWLAWIVSSSKSSFSFLSESFFYISLCPESALSHSVLSGFSEKMNIYMAEGGLSTAALSAVKLGEKVIFSWGFSTKNLMRVMAASIILLGLVSV